MHVHIIRLRLEYFTRFDLIMTYSKYMSLFWLRSSENATYITVSYSDYWRPCKRWLTLWFWLSPSLCCFMMEVAPDWFVMHFSLNWRTERLCAASESIQLLPSCVISSCLISSCVTSSLKCEWDHSGDAAVSPAPSFTDQLVCSGSWAEILFFGLFRHFGASVPKNVSSLNFFKFHHDLQILPADEEFEPCGVVDWISAPCGHWWWRHSVTSCCCCWPWPTSSMADALYFRSFFLFPAHFRLSDRFSPSFLAAEQRDGSFLLTAPWSSCWFVLFKQLVQSSRVNNTAQTQSTYSELFTVSEGWSWATIWLSQDWELRVKGLFPHCLRR